MRRPLRMNFSFDARLRDELESIARTHQSVRMHRRGVWLWGSVAVAILAGLLLRFAVPSAAPALGPLILISFAVAAGLSVAWLVRDRLDLLATARAIERDHPELREALRTAAEQSAASDGRLNFLQRRLLKHALDQAGKSGWHLEPRQRSRQLAFAHTLSAAAAVILGAYAIRHSAPLQWNWLDWTGTRSVAQTGEIEITPGDSEIERGSTVIVAARFSSSPPAAIWLEWHNAAGQSGRVPMARSLSDPVFAHTLGNIQTDTVYAVTFADERHGDFALTVFELPDLVRADASLDYPDYTGLADRQITDTRRLSAVEGTQLDYTFVVNRPLATATLENTDTAELITLEPRNPDRTEFGTRFTLAQSARYRLLLNDDEGRADPAPADIRIEVTPNQRPELRLTFPRGDQRVSPLQEIHLAADARDDFGLLDFGVATAIGAKSPDYVSFATSANGEARRETKIEHLIALENEGVEINELVTWFAWADDFGPDGERRRTTSDLFFAEVRPLDEIFREQSDAGGTPPSGGESGPAGELLEMQRQLSIAIWKLRQTAPPGPDFDEEATVLHDSQAAALTQLDAVRQRLADPNLQGAVERAQRAMELARDRLGQAAESGSVNPLEPAWTASQTAYQALLQLQPRETNIVQGQNGSGSGGRNRGQIDQLRLRREANRYANASQPEAEVPPEEREQLNLLSRLRELSRRQQDLNDRLQELQNALAAAADENEREEIRRELKRLEEEQRRMLADLDEARQRLDRLSPGEQREETRRQLDETRQEMQAAGEQLSQGEVSSALAAGTRVRENLNETGERLREDSTSVFGEQLRSLRQQARELSEQQENLQQRWDEARERPPSLDGIPGSEELATALSEQQERHAQLLDDLRQVTEDSEGTEPTLHRQLYDLLREQGAGGPARALETSEELLRRGFLDEAERQQAGVARAFERLQSGIESAAESVLGNASAEMRFAAGELDALSRQLEQERAGANPTPTEDATADTESSPAPSDQTGETDRVAQTAQTGESPSRDGTGAPGQPGDSDAISQTLAQLLGGDAPGDSPNGERRPGEGPLTGSGFADWADRLRTVESLVDDEQLRQRLGEARSQAEDMRREFQRRGSGPRWDVVDTAVLAPLQEVRQWLDREIARRDDPTVLQPVDRDPVPEKFAEAVRRYYEALGTEP